jgi:hypothetical protein
VRNSKSFETHLHTRHPAPVARLACCRSCAVDTLINVLRCPGALLHLLDLPNVTVHSYILTQLVSPLSLPLSTLTYRGAALKCALHSFRQVGKPCLLYLKVQSRRHTFYSPHQPQSRTPTLPTTTSCRLPRLLQCLPVPLTRTSLAHHRAPSTLRSSRLSPRPTGIAPPFRPRNATIP